MILREIVQDRVVDRVVAERRLMLGRADEVIE
jgi:hypothetical protein